MDPLSKSEYEIQLYDVSLNKLNSILKEEVIGTVLSKTDELYEKFKVKNKDMDEATYDKFIMERENLKKVILSKLESPVEKFQSHLLKNLQIPDNVLLPEHELYENSISEHDLQEYQTKISNMEQEVLKLKYKIQEYALKSQRCDDLVEHVKNLGEQVSARFSSVLESDPHASRLVKSLCKLKEKVATVKDLEEDCSNLTEQIGNEVAKVIDD